MINESFCDRSKQMGDEVVKELVANQNEREKIKDEVHNNSRGVGLSLRPFRPFSSLLILASLFLTDLALRPPRFTYSLVQVVSKTDETMEKENEAFSHLSMLSRYSDGRSKDKIKRSLFKKTKACAKIIPLKV